MINRKQYQRDWYQKNKSRMDIYFKSWRDKNGNRVQKYRITYHTKLKASVFNFYGNECACCGEKNKLFLTMDHVNNDGFKELLPNGQRRSGPTLYLKIIEQGFPSSYQILCWNCNCGKRMNKGVCPHLGDLGT